MFGDDLTMFNSNSKFESEPAYDSEEDQIIQYADSNAPLNYKEMPTSVCDSKSIHIIFAFWMPHEKFELWDKKIE